MKDSKLVYFLPPPVDESKHDPAKIRKNETMNEYRESVRKILGDKVVYLNSDDFYGKLGKHGIEYHISDGVHLNQVGYVTLFNELSKLFTKLLNSSA